MKRYVCLAFSLVAILCISAQVSQLGVPFFCNYTSTDYNGNNRNSDVSVDENGNVFVANFEGLLYYDQASWRIEHLTNLTRPTALYRDSKNVLWVGGYNYFGKVATNANGALYLLSIENKADIRGEVAKIWEEGKELKFILNNDNVYKCNVADNRVTLLGKKAISDSLISLPFNLDVAATQVLTIDNGLKAVATTGRGLFLFDNDDNLLCNITEQNGLCSNNINRLAYNGKGMLWGATENGIFSMSIPSPYTIFGKTEGIHGEVYSICKFAGKTYVGTTSGLYRQNGLFFEHIDMINHLCWTMEELNGQLLIGSEGGLYAISSGGNVRQLNSSDTRALKVVGDVFYTGEGNGCYLNKLSGERYVVCNQPNVIRILTDENKNLWLQTLYGEIWCRKTNQPFFSLFKKDIAKDKFNSLMRATLVEMAGKVIVLDIHDKSPFAYPQFSYTDRDGFTWLTNDEGINLYAWKDGKRYDNYDMLLYPIRNEVIRCMWVDDKTLWFGGKNGVIVIDRLVNDPLSNSTPNLRICSMTVNGENVVWGGFGTQPTNIGSLKNSQNNIAFTFAVDFSMMQGAVLYQYRMDNNEWSKPSVQKHALFNNQSRGRHTFEVKAIDSFGHETNIAAIQFDIQAPFYLKWYMIALYVILLGVLFVLLMRWRTQRLEKEKLRLESIVNERTAEVVKQRDEIVKQKNEIEEKSQRLETALDDLNQAQHELIRQEKLATVGNLTKGLIDRILNPLNYINNFSKLSQSLVKDIETNIEKEKDKIDEEEYEDTMDVLGMLTGNLEKVSEHGQNTTRTLKAMEEMLKDRSGGIAQMELTSVLRQDQEMMITYYAKEIEECRINVRFNIPDSEIQINGNASQLSKTFMSIINNSIYAVVKKSKQDKFDPEVAVSVTTQGKNVVLKFFDNGIGIEDTIIDKIFDPFFTTKTTGEASGVGLYLSKEIIQNHGGDISVKSEKNVCTELTIVLPTL